MSPGRSWPGRLHRVVRRRRGRADILGLDPRYLLVSWRSRGWLVGCYPFSVSVHFAGVDVEDTVGDYIQPDSLASAVEFLV